MISPSSFAYVADLLRQETAMLCEPGKEYLVEARLLPLARAAGHSDVDSYVARLPVDLADVVSLRSCGPEKRDHVVVLVLQLQR